MRGRSRFAVYGLALIAFACTESAVDSVSEPGGDQLISATARKAKNQKPIAVPGGPYSGTVGEAITLDGSGSSDPDGSIVQYSWTFGDGASSSTGPSVQHTYQLAGTFDARLRVRDNRGRWSGWANTTVTVEDDVDPPTGEEFVFAAAGDIAACGGAVGDDSTAVLLDGIDGEVLALGDNAYPDGRLIDYQNCYEPTWGRHKDRTWPVPGNHEYDSGNPDGYFDYFGARAGARDDGWYSFDRGDWHIVALNSERGMEADSAQGLWLQADLAASTAQCTLAFFHHPRFNSGTNGEYNRTQGAWDLLYAHGADVVLNGHSHTYERFAPQDPQGNLDLQSGIREFIVGIGGRGNGIFATIRDNSEVRYNTSFGVLELTLGEGSYTWDLIATNGDRPDSGSDVCR